MILKQFNRRKLLKGLGVSTLFNSLPKNVEALTPQQRSVVLGGARWRLPGLMTSLGDSITGRQTDMVHNAFGPDYANLAPYLLNGKTINVYNGGIAGQNSTQVLARAASVAAKTPNGGFMLIMGGWANDAAQAVALSTTQSNAAGMASACKAAGVVPVFVTAPPRGNLALSSPAGLTLTPATSGGTLATGTYAYRVSAVNSSGETLASTEVTCSVTGPTGSVALSWSPVASASAYKVYGRTSGAELLLATVANSPTGTYWGKTVFTDDGSVTPSGAIPASNTTANASTGAIIAATNAINSWLVPWCAQNGYLCIDITSALADSGTGFYKAGYSWDGVHPVGVAERLMAQAVDQVIGPYVYRVHSYLATSEGDAGNLMSNSQFSSNNGLLPTGWSKSGGTATTVVGPLAGFLGNALSITPTNPIAQTSVTSPNITTGFSDGDTLFFGMKVQITGNEAAGANPLIGCRAVSTAYWAGNLTASAIDTNGVAELNAEFTIPAGQGINSFRFEVDSGVFGAGYTVSIGQPTLRNLTTGGLIIP